MQKLSKETLDAIEQKVAAVESQSACELVAVFAVRSDDYHYIPLLWAALTALVVPAALIPWWHPGAGTFFTAQTITFALGALLLRSDRLRVRLVPKSIRLHRAEQMAALQFTAQGLNAADAPPAVLFFISFEERYVRILANAKVPVEDAQWQQVVDTMIAHIKDSRLEEGLGEAIGRIGEILHKACPAAENDVSNRFGNRMRLI